MIASGSIHAVVNAIVKGGRDEMASRAVTDGASAIILLPAILLVPLPAGAWSWLALSGVIHAVYLYALIKAYQLADFSAAYPVLRGTAPAVTALITIGFLGEPTSLAEIAGIALIAAAMFALASQRHLGRAALGWSLLTGCRSPATPWSTRWCSRRANQRELHRLDVRPSRDDGRGHVQHPVARRDLRRRRRAMEAGRAGRRAIDPDLRHGADRALARTDRAAGGAARNRHADRPGDLGLRPWRTGDRGPDGQCRASPSSPARD